jgi:hypothetical protein
MLTYATLSLLNFVLGAIVGIYLPLAGLYLFAFARRGHFGFALVWRTGLRLLLALFGFFMVLAVLGFAVDLSGGNFKFTAWLGIGAIVAFFTGTVLFFVGIWRAWKARARARLQGGPKPY